LKLSLLSLVASVLIVCLHAPSTDCRGVSMLVESFVGTHLAAVAVLFFFAVSGYLLGMQYGEGATYAAVLRKRVRSVLVPYAIWCVVLGSSAMATTFLANFVHHQPLMRFVDFNVINLFGLNPKVNPPQPLWYLRALMLFVVASPVVMALVGRGRWRTYAVIAALWIGGLFAKTGAPEAWSVLFDFTLAPTSTIPFVLGLTLSRCPVAVSRGMGGLLLVLGLILTVVNCAGRYGLWLDGTVYYTMRQGAVALVLIGVWSVCPVLELPSWLKGQAFPIYLLHGVMMSAWLVVKTLAPSFALSWPGWFVGVVLMVLGSIVVSGLLRKLCPTVASVAFGGR